MEGSFAMRIVIVAVVATAMLLLSIPSFAQAQSQAYCEWDWGYKYNPAGGYEYWCWDPQFGWWYSTDGKNKSMDVVYTG